MRLYLLSLAALVAFASEPATPPAPLDRADTLQIKNALLESENAQLRLQSVVADIRQRNCAAANIPLVDCDLNQDSRGAWVVQRKAVASATPMPEIPGKVAPAKPEAKPEAKGQK